MFNIFSRSKDYQLPTKEQLPTDKNIEDYTVPEKSKKSTEHYRVGFTDDGYVTLTFMSGSFSSTLYLTPGASERLIRMLRSTYEEDEVDVDDEVTKE